MPELIYTSGKITLIILLVYAVVLTLITVFQRRLVFQAKFVFRPSPFEPLYQTKPTIEPQYLCFTLRTADGEAIDAVWAPNVEHDIPMLYLHGNATNLLCRRPRLRVLNSLGFSVLAIDWRGYGKSSGRPSQKGLQLDAEAALGWLRQRVEPSRVVLFGESIGTGVAVELAAKHKFRALVLEAPFFSALDLAKAYLPIFPVQRFMRDHFRSDLWIGEIRADLLIQHGRRDRTVPFSHGEKLYAIAQEPKRFIAYPKGHHDDLPEKNGSYQDLRDFVMGCPPARR